MEASSVVVGGAVVAEGSDGHRLSTTFFKLIFTVRVMCISSLGVMMVVNFSVTFGTTSTVLFECRTILIVKL